MVDHPQSGSGGFDPEYLLRGHSLHEVRGPVEETPGRQCWKDTMEKSAKKTGKTGYRAADMAWLAGLSGNWFEPVFGGDGRRSGEMPGLLVVLMCSLFMPQEASTRSSMAGSYLRDSPDLEADV